MSKLFLVCSKKRESKNKYKKSKMKKRHLSSSSSSSDGGEELRLLQRLEAKQLRMKYEKKKQKEQIKASETPDEKRTRRLREKQEKKRKYCYLMGCDNEYHCYTNQDNPFGDSALTNSFVWTKKLVKEGVKALSRDELEALNRQKQLENKMELKKLKQRRLEIEAEREAKSETAAAALHSDTWARQEDAFQLHQARLRSQIRIRGGRAKPIDLLAKYVSSEECGDALEMHEPLDYLKGLQSQDLEDLLEDIKVYKELEGNVNQTYWEDVQTIVLDEVDKLRRLAAPSAHRGGIHQAVADDVTQIFKGKTVAQLEALQTQMEHKLRGCRDGVDVAYWEGLLAQLKAHMSHVRLRERHQRMQLARAGQRTAGTQHAGQRAGGTAVMIDRTTVLYSSAQGHEVLRAAVPESTRSSGEWEAETDVEECLELYRAGRYSPAPLSQRALALGARLVAPAHDEVRLARRRAHLCAGGTRLLHQMEPAVGSVSAGTEVLPEQPCLTSDKFRPRKPLYFNRVHTGFEWNKYNQTHYDMDNPPPELVQGYKFNIFYPDLVDKSATPGFSLKACPENPDFAVVRFHAGAPYEDIAFKIVNREWEHSYKRGFRCHFHNNIFQLWFHFKRYRYRR